MSSKKLSVRRFIWIHAALLIHCIPEIDVADKLHLMGPVAEQCQHKCDDWLALPCMLSDLLNY